MQGYVLLVLRIMRRTVHLLSHEIHQLSSDEIRKKKVEPFLGNCQNSSKLENRSGGKTMAAALKASMSLLGAPGSGEFDWHEYGMNLFVMGHGLRRYVLQATTPIKLFMDALTSQLEHITLPSGAHTWPAIFLCGKQGKDFMVDI